MVARNHVRIASPAREVFEELIEPHNFGYWVVGTKGVRSAEADWPEIGSAFHHSLGFGPVHIEDHTEVVEREEPERLVLRARMRPLGTVVVRLFLQPVNGHTNVVMEEEALSGLLAWAPAGVAERLVALRNRGALRRLKHLVETEEHAGELDERTPFSRSGGLPRSTLVCGLGVSVATVVAVWAWRRRRGRGPGGGR